jgi:parallel beta-helix repeat protein
MNSRISWQQFNGLLFVPSIFALLLAASDRASAIDIKDTNYPIPSGAYFVSPDGKDTNSGKTPDSPWPVGKALASAPSGSTVVFRGGTYRNITANINKKLTLQAYPHEKPWLKGSIVVSDWVKDGGRWRKDNWRYSFPVKGNNKIVDGKYPMARFADMVYINGVSLKQVASKAKVVPGTFYVDAANNKLYIGDNPAHKTVEATAVKEGFNIEPKSGSSTLIRGLGFAHYADSALNVFAPRVTVENNTLVWNGVAGASFTGADARIRSNTFSYNGRKGLSGYQAHRMLLENNTISYNNVERFAITWDAAGVKAIDIQGLTWRNNIVEHNFATGMWVDESSTNSTLVKNSIRKNQGIGILFEISHKAIIAANLVYKNATAGIMISESSSARVYNNTLSMNNKHIVVKDDRRKNIKAAEVAAGITWSTHGNVIKNNILSSARGTALFEASDCITKKQSALMIDTADYNAYYRPSSSQSQSLIKWSLGKGKCSVGYTSIAAFDAATNFEANALAVDNLPTNPFFVDEGNEDYRLKLNSPAIGRSSPLPADIAKAIGLPPGTPLDLGALQSKVH